MTLDELVALLVRGVTSPSYVGIWEHRTDQGDLRRWRVWRRGRLARIEDPPGTVTLIAGDDQYWRKWPTDPQVVLIPRSPDHDDFEMSALTMLEPERYWRDWLTLDTDLVLGTLREVRHEERHAWQFTAPQVKGRRPVLTVDAELGLVLAAEHPGLGVVDAWTDVRSDVPLGDELFRWDESDHSSWA